MTHLTIKGNKRFKNRKQAIYYCTQECPDHHLGCAVDCNIRIRFKMPPHE